MTITDQYKTTAAERAACRRWRKNHPGRVKVVRRRSYIKHHTRCLRRSRLWKQNNPEKVLISQRLWRKKNPGKLRAEKRRYMARRNLRDPQFRLRNQLRHRIYLAVKSQNGTKSYRTLKLLGCSVEQLREWLEAQFEPGMSWSNHGEWHIDHIQPCASFDLSDPAQQRQCFNFTNLQPLWAEDNHLKSNKI